MSVASAITAATPVLVRIAAEAPVAPRELTGGKAATLSLLAHHGLPIPRGFCLTTEAYLATLQEHGLLDSERELRARLPDEAARAALSELLCGCTLPAALRGAIESELNSLFGEQLQPRLAVRSSAVGEDGASHSFAGAHDSVLGVQCDIAGVETAVQRCWRSLWSPRAVSYREQFAVDGGAMAVLIQELLDPEIAAVAFTKDPVTDLDERILVSVTSGLGDALMSGSEEGTTITLDRRTRDVLGLAGRNAAAHRRSVAAIRQLGTLALLIERLLGKCADIEAVHTTVSGWSVVQARPVTT